jgi:hypothetical protein
MALQYAQTVRIYRYSHDNVKFYAIAIVADTENRALLVVFATMIMELAGEVEIIWLTCKIVRI